MTGFLYTKHHKDSNVSNLLEKEMHRFAKDYGLTLDEVRTILQNAIIRDMSNTVALVKASDG